MVSPPRPTEKNSVRKSLLATGILDILSRVSINGTLSLDTNTFCTRYLDDRHHFSISLEAFAYQY
jgi:hypothetical protein